VLKRVFPRLTYANAVEGRDAAARADAELAPAFAGEQAFPHSKLRASQTS
jgi:hypothetical protein